MSRSGCISILWTGKCHFSLRGLITGYWAGFRPKLQESSCYNAGTVGKPRIALFESRSCYGTVSALWVFILGTCITQSSRMRVSSCSSDFPFHLPLIINQNPTYLLALPKFRQNTLHTLQPHPSQYFRKRLINDSDWFYAKSWASKYWESKCSRSRSGIRLIKWGVLFF